MTGPSNFRLPSLAVSCSYDDPPQTISLPARLEDRDAPVAVLEGAFRPHTKLCRFVRSDGLIGLQLPDPVPERIRVVMRLVSDLQTGERWVDRQRRTFEVRARRNIADEESEHVVGGRHRLVRVSAQGSLRGHVVLEDPRDADGRVAQRIDFEVPGEQIDESRLLLISLGGARGVPDWQLAERLPDSLVGVCAAWARVEVGDGAARAALSTGRAVHDRWQPWLPGIGYACLNRSGGPVHLTVGSDGETGGRRRLGLGRRSPGWPGAVEIADDRGGVQTLELPRRGDDGTATVTVPSGTDAAFVRLLGLPDELESPLQLRAAVAAG